MSQVIENHPFSVDQDSSEPLYMQLGKAINHWIETATLGDRLPPELEIADIAGVTRKTVRKAIEPFIEQGIFSRRARIGTVLEKKPLPIFEHLHPLEENFNFTPTTTVKLALFSASRHRRKLWTTLVDNYNSSTTKNKVELIWAPNSINSPESYRDFVREWQADIIFLSDSLFDFFKDNELLSCISDDLIQQMKSDDYSINTFFADIPAYPLDYIMPLYFSLSGMIWNQDMISDTLPAPSFLTRERALSFLHELDNHLLVDNMLFSNINCFLGGFGFPKAGADSEHILNWLRLGYEAVRRLSSSTHEIHVSDRYRYEFVNVFLERKAASSMLNMYSINHCLNRLSFNWVACPLKSKSGYFNNTGYNGLAISRACSNTDVANDFLRFMLSEESLSFLSINSHFGVFHKKAAATLCESTFRNTDACDLEDIIARYRLHSRNTERWIQTICFDLLEQIEKVFKGQTELEKAVKKAFLRYQHLSENFKFGGEKL